MGLLTTYEDHLMKKHAALVSKIMNAFILLFYILFCDSHHGM